jgi:hypothetical protein
MTTRLVCDCESPGLTLDDDRTPHCSKCGKTIVSLQGAAIVRVVRAAVNGMVLDEETLDALADRIAERLRR